MSARKLWATQFSRVPALKKRHESKAAAYRYLSAESANWLCGAIRSQHVNVYVDEREGRGWELYERIDLATFGSES